MKGIIDSPVPNYPSAQFQVRQTEIPGQDYRAPLALSLVSHIIGNGEGDIFRNRAVFASQGSHPYLWQRLPRSERKPLQRPLEMPPTQAGRATGNDAFPVAPWPIAGATPL